MLRRKMIFGSHTTLNGACVDSNSFEVLTGCCTISCQGLVLVVMQRIKHSSLCLDNEARQAVPYYVEENGFRSLASLACWYLELMFSASLRKRTTNSQGRIQILGAGQVVWYLGYLLALLLQARKKDVAAVGLRALSDSQVTEIHTDLSSFP